MGKVKDKMTADLALRNYSDNTKDAYLRIAEAFVKYYRRPPQQLGEHEARTYLLNRREQVKPATVAVDLAAIKFLYEVTLDKPEVVARIPRPKVYKPLPDVLSGSEVVALLEAVESIKHRTLLTTAYGAGLRIYEACSLHQQDIDSKRMASHHPQRRAKSTDQGRRQDGAEQTGDPSHAPPRLRHSHARERRRYQARPGAARSQLDPFDPDLHPHQLHPRL